MNIPISILLCLLFTMITGTIAYLFYWILSKANKSTNVLKTRYVLLKVVIFAFILPVCFLIEVIFSYNHGTWTGILFVVTPTLYKIAGILLGIWGIGCIVTLVSMVSSTKEYRLSLKVYKKTEQYDDILKEIKHQMGVQRRICVKYGCYYESPFYAGFFRPTIYIPVDSYSKAELKHIFLHELTHYKHRDMWMLCILKVLACIYWFHPLFRKNRLFLQYRELLEDACDIDVCKQIQNYREYIAVLIRMVLKMEEVQNVAPIFLSESYEDVLRRIDNMERYQAQKPLKRLLVTILMVVVFCTSSVVVFAAESGMEAGYKQAYNATWEGLEEEMNGNTTNTLKEVYELAVEDEDITIEYDSNESISRNTYSNFQYTINGNTEKRQSITRELKAGDKVLVALSVDPMDKNVKVGFYMSNGYVRYITGSGNIYHTFTIYDDDTYRFFIQNMNSTTIDVNGYYSIQ